MTDENQFEALKDKGQVQGAGGEDCQLAWRPTRADERSQRRRGRSHPGKAALPRERRGGRPQGRTSNRRHMMEAGRPPRRRGSCVSSGPWPCVIGVDGSDLAVEAARQALDVLGDGRLDLTPGSLSVAAAPPRRCPSTGHAEQTDAAPVRPLVLPLDRRADLRLLHDDRPADGAAVEARTAPVRLARRPRVRRADAPPDDRTRRQSRHQLLAGPARRRPASSGLPGG